MTDKTGAAIMARHSITFREAGEQPPIVGVEPLRAWMPDDEPTYFACLEVPDATPGPMFVHFNPPLAVLPGETIHEAHARQPWVRVAVLPEPLVPPGPVEPPVAEADESKLSPALLRQMAPLVWQHVARYGFAPVPWSAAAWRGERHEAAGTEK